MFAKKFLLTLFTCLIFITDIATAKGILKDADCFSYIINYNYLIFSSGNKACTAYDLSSIHILADNNSRFEFNVITAGIGFYNEQILGEQIRNIREDYNTGKIFVDGEPLKNSNQWGKTQREIYYKIKSAALSR